MKVTYRANGETAVLTEDAGRQLVAAGICDALADAPPKELPKREPPSPKKSDKSTKVEPMTTEDMPVPTKQVT